MRLLTFFKHGREEIGFAVYEGPNPVVRKIHLRRLTTSEIQGGLKGDDRFERYSGGLKKKLVGQ